MAKSSIEWTEVTWNPTTGCDQTSPGCDNCYAMTMAKRLKAMGQPKYQADGDSRTSGPGFALTLHPDTLADPLRWRNSRLVFVNSMSDLFHPDVPDDFIARVFEVMNDTPQHTYQVLTKRANRLQRSSDQFDWPQNLWLGVSVETQRYAFRAECLRHIPVPVRFVSAEPLLGPLDLDLSGIDWLIVGGESGPGARQMEARWAESLRDASLDLDTAFFFKQWGGRTPKAGGRTLGGRLWDEMPTPRARLAS